jgi:hypothetical protein
MKIRVGSRVVLYGPTDMTELTVAFRNFANAPNRTINFIKIQYVSDK